ncbi:2-C-methyl-D-erythritol 4-phosphate cytidylyltransferase [subsurface metagenome]
MNIAIICAGGNGERMQTKENKIFLKINGKPIIYYTLKTLSEYEKIDSIIVTTGEEYVIRLKKIISQNNIKKVSSVENAYDTRQESTYHVIGKLKNMNPPKESFVIIHNAVNPFVRHSELDECLDAAHKDGASLLGFQASDTVKMINDNYFIDYTPNRNVVWIAQTPQIIQFDIAVKAFEHAFKMGFIATDDSTLVEAIHGKVKFVECSRENFKITYPQDMELAKQIHLRRIKEKNIWFA